MLALILVVAVIAVWWMSRASDLFLVSVRDGKVLVVRGRVPVSLLQHFAETVADPKVARGTIRAYKTETGSQLRCAGAIDEGREQRMRNAFMLYPASQLRHAPPIARPTVGQLVGVAWLAWMLDRR